MLFKKRRSVRDGLGSHALYEDDREDTYQISESQGKRKKHKNHVTTDITNSYLAVKKYTKMIIELNIVTK